MSRSADIILQSFSEVSDRVGDITSRIYSAYFLRCPESDDLMIQTDERMKGRMISEVLKLLMSDDLSQETDYLRFETKTHAGYGVKPMMYKNLLLSVKDVAKESLGSDWLAEFEYAWDERIQALISEIDNAVKTQKLDIVS